jgi:hypothetical protein
MSMKTVFTQIGLRYGLIGGVFAILMFFIMIFMDKIPLVSMRLFDFILIPVFLFLSVKHFKEYANNGELRFWQGMTVTFFTYLILSLTSALFIYVYLTWFNYPLFEEFVQLQVDKIVLNREQIINQTSEAQYEQLLNGMQNSKVIHSAIDDVFKKAFVWLFISPVISLFMRTNMKQ